MLNWIITKSLPVIPKAMVQRVAKKYVAGETLQEAITLVQKLHTENICATLDVLGEFVRDRSQVEQTLEQIRATLIAIHEYHLKSGVSVKATSLGMDLDDEYCYLNLRSLVQTAKSVNRFVRIDMENSPYTNRTLNMYRRLRNDGFENTGVVIQACLRRSREDILSLAALKAPVRLCKGIYIEPEAISYQSRVDIQENFKQLLTLLFENGMHAAIATHDDILIDFARDYIHSHAVSPTQYEFQMLLGVRENKRAALVKEGFKVRVYIPYGTDWYGYSIRRLQENPTVARHILRAMIYSRYR